MKSTIQLWEAVGRQSGGGVGKLGGPTKTIYTPEHGYIKGPTTTWENAHDVTSGEECRIKGDTWGMIKET